MSNCNDQRQNLNLKLKNICKPYPRPNFEMKPTESNGNDLPKVTGFGPRENGKEDAARKAVLAAAEEWDEVASIVPQLQTRPNYSTDTVKPPTPLISFEQAFSAFRAGDLSKQMDKIGPFPIREKRGFAAFLEALFGESISKLDPCLMPERDDIFAIAMCQVDWDFDLSDQILLTIYKRLTGTRLDCPIFGRHWLDVGFQDTDPFTDIRGVGMLGILQLLHLATSKQLEPLLRDILRLSQSDIGNFPLAVMSINLTKIALDTLRRGQLNRECNSRGSVITVLNDFYSAVFCHLFLIWSKKLRSIHDSYKVLNDVEKYCSRHVAKALRKLQLHLSSYAKGNGCRTDAAAPAEPLQERIKRCTDDCDPAFDNVLSTGAS